MKTRFAVRGCPGCGVTRRGFLAAGCAACAGVMAAPRAVRAAQDARVAADARKTRIRVVYSLHAEVQPRPDWPNIGFDFRPVMERINTELAEGCPDFEFLPAMASGAEEADKILAEDAASPVDGYVVYQLNCWNRVVQSIAQSGKPVLYADFQFGGSGGFLVYTAGFLRSQAPNVGFVASSRMADHVAAVRCFSLVKEGGSAADFVAATARVRAEGTPKPGDLTCTPDPVSVVSPEECLRAMRASKILAVRDEKASAEDPYMEIPLEYVAFAEVNEAWEKADKDEARAIADRWEKAATAIEDVSRETLETSACMYLGMKDVLKKHGANAITINCLGGFYGGHIHAYPCLGFHELNNEGLIGACECDI
ncbi:MAG: hypothetical protein JXR94_02040, partial [Candidatus Hydrogenedentes bacterium]|nr:hypothetical protein [Candidatus Hydrogenedentota bacterium]